MLNIKEMSDFEITVIYKGLKALNLARYQQANRTKIFNICDELRAEAGTRKLLQWID
jgi:hypothetical protein